MTDAAVSQASLKRGCLAAFLVFGVLLFAALGIWQVDRRAWKLALMAAVDARVHAPPIPAPGPAAWPRITAERDAYRHVRVLGRFLPGRETLVRAVTVHGEGFWVMAPLRTDAGWTLLVNRGFVPQELPPAQARSAGRIPGPTSITGLLRMTEPHGAFLRANDPAADRWYARDVAAIARRRGLGPVAPYFIDADATPNAGGLPIGGLTVIAFRNSHLAYTLTWFSLAGLSLFMLVRLLRMRLEDR